MAKAPYSFLILIFIFGIVLKTFAATSTASYRQQQSKYCSQQTEKNCEKLPGQPCPKGEKIEKDTEDLSSLNLVLACQNFYRENRCDEVKNRLPADRRGWIMSCEPENICKEADWSVIDCSIKGVRMQFQLPALAMNVGFGVGASLVGGSIAASVAIMTPFIVIGGSISAERCQADTDYKRMAIQLHNLSLYENEKKLDPEGKDEAILKMQCSDLLKFLRTREDVFVQKRIEQDRWSLTSTKRELPGAQKALLEILKSNQCYQPHVVKEEICEALAGFVAGTGIGAAGAKVVKESLKKVNAAAASSAKGADAVGTAGVQKRYADLLSSVEGQVDDVVREIARLEAKGVSTQAIRARIQEVSRNPQMCGVQ